MVLALSVSEPVESHVHCFGFDLFAFVVGNGHCGAVVCGYRGLLLGVAQFLEGHPNGKGFFGIKVQCSYFSFSCRSKDVLLDLDKGMHGSIVWNVLVMAFVTEPEVSACPAPCFWGCEVGGVTVNMELHGAGVISDGCLWMGGEIIQHAVVLLDGVCGCLGLL